MHTQKHTDTETGKHTYAHIQMQTHRQTNGHTNTQTHSNKTGGYRTTKTDRQIHRQTQTVTQRDTKTHRKTDRRVGVSYFGVTAERVFPVTMAFLNAVRSPRPLRTGQIAQGAEQTRVTVAEAEDPVAVPGRTLLRAFHVTLCSVVT